MWTRGSSNAFDLNRTEMPLYRQREMWWWYYENNSLYDNLVGSGQLSTPGVRILPLRNPAARVVEWYAATVWSGPSDTAHPMVLDMPDARHDAFRAAIDRLWSWSNWHVVKQEIVRDAAVAGAAYLKVAQPANGARRVYLERLDSALVTEEKVDERGYVTLLRLDFVGKDGMWRTEVWEPDRRRVWLHRRGRTTPVEQLGAVAEETPMSQWGIDFVPIVRFAHRIVRGVPMNAFFPALEKIDELNRQVTRLHAMMFRHNEVTWALEANATDASGRPMAAPLLGGLLKRGDDTVDLNGERLVRLPGNSRLVPLVPALDYSAAMAMIEAQMAEIEADLPETLWHRLQSMPDLSGRAIRLILSPARARTIEVRGNHEAGLERAHMMALTIGAAIGAFQERQIGRYDAGDFAHHFAPRPVLPLEREEIADLLAVETGAGIPLVTSLRNSGWLEEELDQLTEDKAEAEAGQQQSLATALLNAQGQLAAGGQASGLE